MRRNKETIFRVITDVKQKAPTCSGNVGEWMQLNCLRLSCRTRTLIEACTTSMLFSWRSFTASRLARPPGLASANRRSSCVAIEMAWPGGSNLKVKIVKETLKRKKQQGR